MRVRTVLALAVAIASPALGYAQGPGMTLFQERCATCHMATPPPDNRAPSLTGLRNLSPEAVLVAITTGPMAPNAEGLTDPQRRTIAEYLGGRAIGAGETSAASAMTNQCRPAAMGDIAKMPRWNGWGGDVENSRFQPSERLRD